MGIANIDALTAELAGLKAEYKIIANKLAAIPYPYNTASNPSWVALKNQLETIKVNIASVESRLSANSQASVQTTPPETAGKTVMMMQPTVPTSPHHCKQALMGV